MINAAKPTLALRVCLLAALAVLAVPFARAQETSEEAPPKSLVEALQKAGVKLISGPATYPLGSVAEIQLPAGYHGIEAGSLKRYYELTENMMSGDEAGVVLAPGRWTMFFDYEAIGYVKDDDKDKLDAGKLMKSMLEGQEAANKARAERGWAEMKYAGWANEPRYDEKTNNLTWAVRLTTSEDGHKEPFINESIRLLGRGGVMNVTLATGSENFAANSATAAGLLAKSFSYVVGQRYAEFREGDKIAEYGLTALVLGGAGAAAFKLGFFQKFWKLLVFGGLAVAAGAKKIWAKLTGRDTGREFS